MPQNPEKFSEKMPEWSRWKHEILLGYLGAFAGILQKFQTVIFVDGFAGAGKYDDDNKGSALRTAELARSIKYNPKRNYELHCINVEQDEDVFIKLKENTENYSEFVSNYHGNFNDNIWKIMGEIAEQPTLFFIDPFGVKELNWDDLTPIFSRKPVGKINIITEFLARYDVQVISRLAGCVGKEDERSKRNVQVLLRIFGFNSVVQWKDLIKKTGTTLMGLTEAYQIRLREHFDYVVRMPIKRTDNGLLKYYLIFASRSEKAIKEMNHVLYKTEDMRDNVIDETTLKQPQQKGFFDDPTSMNVDYFLLNELNTLKKLVQNTLTKNHPINRAKLITKIATTDDYFGAFSDYHFTAVLGGNPRKIDVPKEFVSLKNEIELSKAPSNDKSLIKLL